MRLLPVLLFLFACSDQVDTSDFYSDVSVSLAQDASALDVQVIEIPD